MKIEDKYPELFSLPDDEELWINLGARLIGRPRGTVHYWLRTGKINGTERTGLGWDFTAGDLKEHMRHREASGLNIAKDFNRGLMIR